MCRLICLLFVSCSLFIQTGVCASREKASSHFFLGMNSGVDFASGSNTISSPTGSSTPYHKHYDINSTKVALGINFGGMIAVSDQVSIGQEISFNPLGGAQVVKGDASSGGPFDDTGIGYGLIMATLNYYPKTLPVFFFSKLGTAYSFSNGTFLGSTIDNNQSFSGPAVALGFGKSIGSFSFTMSYQYIRFNNYNYDCWGGLFNSTKYPGVYNGSINSLILAAYWNFG